MFSQAVADEICARLEQGQSLRAVCEDKELPSAPTVIRWARENPEFSEQYTRSREIGWSLLADEVISIADSREIDPASRRIMFDARRWMLSKMLPKVYGDKLDLNHSGGVTIVATPTDENL